MSRSIAPAPWRPSLDDAALADALERGALVCISVEAVAGARVETIVLPWPRALGRCLVFHDPGPTRRLELPADALGGSPAVGELYAAELAAGAPADAPLAWPPVDVTAQVRAFTRPG